MAKKDTLKEMLKKEKASGLQTLLGYENAPQTPQQEPEEKPEVKADAPVKEEPAGKKEVKDYTARPVGRPKKNTNDMHTSLVIDRDLFNKVKAQGAMMGKSLREVLEEALEEWYAKNR